MNHNRIKAANFLKEYRKLCENEHFIREQMFQTEHLLKSLRISNPSTAPNFGGSSKYEDFLVSQISKKDELRIRLLVVTARKETLKRAIEILKGKEREVIERFFLSDISYGAAEELMEKLSLEKSQIYRIKDAALDKIYAYMSECTGEEKLFSLE